MKITWHSVSPWTGTGYGQQTALFTPRIKALGHDIIISAFYGLQGSEWKWNGIRCLPSYYAQYGTDVLVPHAMAHFTEPGMTRVEQAAANGLVITLCDVWVLDVPYLRDLSVASWAPVDHETLPPAVREWFVNTGAVPIAMSKFGRNIFEEAGLNPLYVPHGIDTTVFSPGDMAEARERAGLPQDAFIVSIVANNTGNDSARKAFSEQIEAFKILRQKHSDAVLVLHTDIDCPIGVRIRALIEDLPDLSVRYTDQYQLRKGMPADRVADIYRSSNLFSNTSWGEGFGIPIIEAQACGTPVVVTDTTAMPELVGEGWKVPGERFWHDSQRAWARRPYVSSIAEAYLDAYDNTSEEQRTRAWLFAQEYDADSILEYYWKPTLTALEVALEKRREDLTTMPTEDSLQQRIREADGFLWIDRGKKTDDWVAFSDHESTLQPIMERHLPEGGVFLDVGAHVGRWSLRMARRASRVYSVEPNPAAIKQLKKHLALNDIENVEIIEQAAWDSWMRLKLDDQNYRLSGGSTRTIESSDEGIRVHAGPLDDTLLDSVERIDLVKLDVEGADLHALRGMAKLLQQHKPVLVVECHDLYGYYTREELHETLKSLNYQWGPVERFHNAEYLVCTYVNSDSRSEEIS